MAETAKILSPDKIVVLQAGYIEQVGSPPTRPASRCARASPMRR